MSTSNAVTSITLPAAADYSTTGQYLFVDVNSAGRAVVVSAQGANAIGVLSNDPDAIDREAVVDIAGVTKVIASAAIAAGAKVTTGTAGKAETAASGDHVVGRAMEAATADGDVISLLLGSNHLNA